LSQILRNRYGGIANTVEQGRIDS